MKVTSLIKIGKAPVENDCIETLFKGKWKRYYLLHQEQHIDSISLSVIASINREMTLEEVQLHVMVTLRRMNELRPTYLCDGTREILLHKLQGRRSDQFAVL